MNARVGPIKNNHMSLRRRQRRRSRIEASVCFVLLLWLSLLLDDAEVRAFSSLQVVVPTSPGRSISSGLSITRRASLPWLHQTSSENSHQRQRCFKSAFALHASVETAASDESSYDIDECDDDEEDFFPEAVIPDPAREPPLSRGQVQSLTVAQLKQQLRLRGLKVSGRKAELVDRLVGASSSAFPSNGFNDNDDDTNDAFNPHQQVEVMPSYSRSKKTSKAQKFAQDQGKELIDVTAYLDEEDQGKETKTRKNSVGGSGDDDDAEEAEVNKPSSDPEVWGEAARIVDDYEGQSPIVDGLTRSVVEFKGSNETDVKAYVVASRDALKPFLAGGGGKNNTTASRKNTATAAEQRLRQIQEQREKAERRPIRMEDNVGLEEGDETGIYDKVLDRDVSDWGVYTQTGAQLSASEVQGILLLSDVYGAFTEDTKLLCETIAFECQPVVVMAPDLFREKPWKPASPEDPNVNEHGQTYEEWRALHDDLRVSVDIRAAAACLRQRYGVASVVVWGTCYGGGRALEAAAGYLPNQSVHDVNGKVGPPLVQPMAVVAWYPTRYNAQKLFGRQQQQGDALFSRQAPQQNNEDEKDDDSRFAVMAVFAGNDKLEGATPEDAETLKSLLEVDERVKDHMVKVFPGQDHGFAHIGLSDQKRQQELGDGFDIQDRFMDEEFGGEGRISIADDGDAQVACLLSTAFMETYSRVFLPTVGPLISKDEDEKEWGARVEMKDASASARDVRQEIQENLDGFVEQPLGGYRIDPNDEEQDEELAKLLRSMEPPEQKRSPYALEDDDDLTTIYAKLKAADDKFQIF